VKNWQADLSIVSRFWRGPARRKANIMSLKGLSTRSTVDRSPTIQALRDLVATLDAAHSAGMAHLLRVQGSAAISPDAADSLNAYATWVYYGSQIPESITRLQMTTRAPQEPRGVIASARARQ